MTGRARQAPTVPYLVRVGVSVAVAIAVAGLPTLAGAHSGGLDSNGGHYCQEAGYEAGTCSPLGSYHCHQSPCADSGSDGDHDHEHAFVGAKSADSGATMRARRMLRRLGRSRERRPDWYDRDKFPHWNDANGDGCDTRQAVLISESRVRALREHDCTVTTGKWRSHYDGEIWRNPSNVDIDHVVALREAWVSGAYDWTRGTRRRFANDLRWKHALRAVTDNVNQSKSDRDPAEWMPQQARCRYAINWVQMKHRWRLKTNAAERRALLRILEGDCGSRKVAVPLRAR